MKNFGERLKSVLAENNFSQKDLSEILGVHINTVNQWIRNKREPSLTYLRLISHYLDVDYTFLITGETSEEYAARKKAGKVSNGFAEYQTKKEEYRETLRKFFMLSESKKKLVANLINELSEKEDRP